MARRISQPYRCRAIEQLARQLLFAPPDKRAEQVRRAEKLHDQIEPGVAYPFEFISYRITGYRSEANEESLLVGEAILPDLRLLIDAAQPLVRHGIAQGRTDRNTRRTRRPAECRPAHHHAMANGGAALAVGYFRNWGGSGQKRLVLPRSAVDRFLAQNKDRVDRAARFSQILPETRARLIERARRIAQAKDVSLNQVATHLARRTGRAVETIRLLLSSHDARNAAHKIFIDRTGPLTAHQKRVIVRAHRMGVRTMKIARHFRRTRTTFSRGLNQHRAAGIRRREIRFVASPLFERPDAGEVILRPITDEEKSDARHAVVVDDDPLLHDLPPVLRPLFASSDLDHDAQRSILVRYNYLKFKAHRLRERLAKHEPRVGDLEQIEEWLRRAVTIRRDFAAASQRIVLSVARRHLIGQPGASANTLLELLDVGQEVLIEAIESFDATKDHEFESYLTWALMRRFASDQATRTKAHRRPDVQAARPNGLR